MEHGLEPNYDGLLQKNEHVKSKVLQAGRYCCSHWGAGLGYRNRASCMNEESKDRWDRHNILSLSRQAARLNGCYKKAHHIY